MLFSIPIKSFFNYYFSSFPVYYFSSFPVGSGKWNIIQIIGLETLAAQVRGFAAFLIEQPNVLRPQRSIFTANGCSTSPPPKSFDISPRYIPITKVGHRGILY